MCHSVFNIFLVPLNVILNPLWDISDKCRIRFCKHRSVIFMYVLALCFIMPDKRNEQSFKLSLSYQGKCIKLVKEDGRFWPLRLQYRLQKECVISGGKVAMLKTRQEMDALRYWYTRGPRSLYAHIGLYHSYTMPHIYRYCLSFSSH